MVTWNEQEVEEARKLIAAGKLPPDAIAQHLEEERQNVFGHDSKVDRHGKSIEQGIGSALNPTDNHFRALEKAEGKAAADAARAAAAKRRGT